MNELKHYDCLLATTNVNLFSRKQNRKWVVIIIYIVKDSTFGNHVCLYEWPVNDGLTDGKQNTKYQSSY